MKNVITKIFNVVILGIILTYVSAMKGKCGYCTDIPETRYVTILSTIILIQVLLFAFFPNQSRSFILSNKWFILVLIVINVANMIYLYRFIGKMNESQCRQCSSEWRRTFLYYYSTVVLILYAINIVLMIFALSVFFANQGAGKVSESLTKALTTRHRKN
jgi:hypothetical protein